MRSASAPARESKQPTYDSVRRYTHEKAYAPQSFAPGEGYQLDWSHEYVAIDGVTTLAKFAQVRPRHSSMPFVSAERCHSR